MDYVLLKSALEKLCQNIGGDWLLVGGSLIRYDVDSSRGTEDIDLVKIPKAPSQRELAELFLLMKTLGLNPTQINSAAQFFVQQVSGWQHEIIPLFTSGKGTIFRPNFTLFFYLKISRASPVDLEDIRRAHAKWLGANPSPNPADIFSVNKFHSWADKSLRLRAEKEFAELFKTSK